jgi:hypothetical protein
MAKTKWAVLCIFAAIISISTFAYAGGDKEALKSDKLMAKPVFAKSTAYGTMAVFSRNADNPTPADTKNYPEDYPENDATVADDFFGNENSIKDNADASGADEGGYRVVVHRLPANAQPDAIQVKESPTSIERAAPIAMAKPTMPVILPKPVKLPGPVRLPAVAYPPSVGVNTQSELLAMKSVEHEVAHKAQKGAGFSAVRGMGSRPVAIMPQDQSE